MVTGESIYFNSKKYTPPTKEEINLIKQKTKDKELNKYYMIFEGKFHTSSIFSTTKDIWNKDLTMFKGQKNGANLLNKIIQKNNWGVIFPIVPRAKDIGMLHEDGWSVSWHGKEKIKEIKKHIFNFRKF